MWAGYDGWYNNDVEQDGATAYCPSAGAPAQFSLWYELYDQRELPGQPDAIWGNPCLLYTSYDVTEHRAYLDPPETPRRERYR